MPQTRSSSQAALSQAPDRLSMIPAELLERVLKQLDWRSLISFSSTCKKYKAFAAENTKILRLRRRATDGEVDVAVKRFPRLQSLSLRHAWITIVGLQFLSSLRELTKLDLIDCRGMIVLSPIGSLKNLRDLSIDGGIHPLPRLSMDALASLTALETFHAKFACTDLLKCPSMSQLTSLHLGDARRVNFKSLHVPRLRSLCISATIIIAPGEEGMAGISCLTTLESLTIEHVQDASGSVAKAIQALTNLTCLRLKNYAMMVNGTADSMILEALPTLPKLRSLDLFQCDVTSEIIPSLSNHPALTYVCLQETQIPPADLKVFKVANPSIRVVGEGVDEETDDSDFDIEDRANEPTSDEEISDAVPEDEDE